jgi:Domain of unknown function (DUF4259)
MICRVGTWEAGPFDNDGAADWGSDLHDARPDDRAAMVRAALTPEDGNMDGGDGQLAVAAIAVVAAVRSGQDLTALALSTLDRVTGEDSEPQELWTEDGPNEAWEAEIAALRAALTR